MSQLPYQNIEIIIPKNIKMVANSKNRMNVKKCLKFQPLKNYQYSNNQSSNNLGLRSNRIQSELSSFSSKNKIIVKKPFDIKKCIELHPFLLVSPSNLSSHGNLSGPLYLAGPNPQMKHSRSEKADQNKFRTFDLRIIETQRKHNNSALSYLNKNGSTIKLNCTSKNKLSNLLCIQNCQFCKQNETLLKQSKNILYNAYEAKTTLIYNTNLINDIIFNANCMACSRFKDYLIYDEATEFIKKFNDQNSSISLIKEMSEFYSKYSKVFPNYILLPEKKYMFKGIEKKQKSINEKHNELIKKTKGSYLNTIGSPQILKDEFLKQIEKSLTRNKITQIEINCKDSKTYELKELLDKYIQNDSLSDTFKNPELLSKAFDYPDCSFAKTKEESRINPKIKAKKEEKVNKPEIILALNCNKKGILTHQRFQSTSNTFLNMISPSNNDPKKKQVNVEVFRTNKKEISLKPIPNIRNEKILKTSSTIKPRTRANSNRKKEIISSPISTKISIIKKFDHNFGNQKENFYYHLTIGSPTVEDGIYDVKKRKIKIENDPRCAISSKVQINKDNEKNSFKRNVSTKKLNPSYPSCKIDINSPNKQKLICHQTKGKKTIEISRQNTLTSSGKTFLLKKAPKQNNILSPKDIQLVYNSARNLKYKNKL